MLRIKDLPEGGGAEVYRSLVAGFASKAEAASFCDKLKAKGRACFLRK